MQGGGKKWQEDLGETDICKGAYIYMMPLKYIFVVENPVRKSPIQSDYELL